MAKKINLEKLLNRNLLIFIFVGLIVGIVIFLTISYERNLKENREIEQTFYLKQEEEKQKIEEKKIKEVTPENIEQKLDLQTTQNTMIEDTFGRPYYSDSLGEGLSVRAYIDRDTGDEVTTITDSSGSLVMYKYRPTGENISFKKYTEEHNLGDWDFYLMIGAPHDSEKILYVDLDRGVALYAEAKSDYIFKVWRFVKMDREDFLRKFGEGMWIKEIE